MEGQFEQRIEQLTQQLTDTRREATIDPLTGAANRRLFEAMMSSGERDIIVAMFDVDNFKRINDTLGHAAGDAVLIAVADAIKTVVRADDVMSRFGGDEFAVLMGAMTLRQAELCLRSIMNTVATTMVGPDNEMPAIISCGGSELSAGDTRDALLARADNALNDAKRAGKSRMIIREAPFIRELAGPAAPRSHRAAGAR